MYLPTKKIGKNNPKAAEIEADNTARQEWNRTADLALVSGIEEAKILEIKQTEIHDKAGQSIRENGWLPNLFRGIVGKAKEFLQAIIREKDMPPKPVLNMDMDEFRTMQTLMLKVQKQAKAIKKIQEVTLPNLRQQLAETTGIFKGKERKALEKQIQQIEAELDEKLDKLPDILTDDGYPDVQAFMKTYRKAEAIITQYKSTARFGVAYAASKYNAIIQAAHDANEFGYILDSNIKRIRLYISFIRKYDEEIKNILDAMHELIDANEETDFVKQIHLVETFKGAGFLSAVTLMGEIGNFSAFSKPKQLFAYFGLDPAVKQSGKFEGTKIQISKRGSAIARRAIHTLTLQSISTSRTGEAKNPVLRDYYLKKCESKPKLVAMGAVSHKVCNMIFAILRDNKPFEIITPQEHIQQYNAAKCDIAA